MTRRIARLVALLFVTTCSAGCGYNSGLLQGAATGNQIQFHMEVAGERYSRTVTGSSSIGAIFCVIPLDEGLFKQAMQAMLEDAHLKPNEALQDVRVDADPVCFLVYGIRRLTISADVYEMTPPGSPAPPTALPAPDASPPPKPKAPRLTYAQLQEALSEVQRDRDGTMRHDIALRILGRPQKTDSEYEFWYAQSGADCYVLRLSVKGATIDEAPNEKCQ